MIAIMTNTDKLLKFCSILSKVQVTHCLGRGGRLGSRACLFLSPHPGRNPGGTSRHVRWPGAHIITLLHVSRDVTWGDSVPSSVNLWPWSWSPMIMCITPCMKGWNTSWLKLWTGWMKGWKAWRKPNPEKVAKLRLCIVSKCRFPLFVFSTEWWDAKCIIIALTRWSPGHCGPGYLCFVSRLWSDVWLQGTLRH